MTKNKKARYFVSYIDGYFPALHFFSAPQNYYLYPLLVAEELGYKPIAIVREGVDALRGDPHLLKSVTVLEYKSFFHFLVILIRYASSSSVMYSNSHTVRSYISVLVMKALRCKTIFMGHIQPKRTTKLRQFIFNTVLFFVDRVRLNTITEKDFLKNEGVGEHKLWVVPIAINTKAFYRSTGDYAMRHDVVYYGNTTKQKGLPTIFKAFQSVLEEFPHVRLHIVGSQGDYDPSSDAAYINIKDHVVLHGAYHHGETLNSLLNSFLVFVISTKAEGQCLAVYEAALAGNALCLPRIMSFTGVFRDKALFHDVNDSVVLAKNIREYLGNQKLLEDNVHKCIEMIHKEYTQDVISGKLRSLLTF